MNRITLDVVHDADSGADNPVHLVSPHDASFTSVNEFIHTRPGLVLSIQSGRITAPRIEFEYINAPVEFGFQYTGRSRTLFRHGGCRGLAHEMLQGDTCITCLPRSAGIVEWEFDASVETVSIIMSPALFLEILREDLDEIPRGLCHAAEGRGCKPYLWNGSDCPSKRITLQRILNCPFHGGIRTMYYEGLALELVGCLMHECLSDGGNCRKTCLVPCPRETERIKAARDLLLQDLENPPSLSQLAEQVGMSETKLKRGFRAVFGKPIFQLYRDYRLEKAREYLENGSMNVSEAAYRIGYLSLGHFSRAFADRFGVTPRRYLQESRSPR